MAAAHAGKRRPVAEAAVADAVDLAPARLDDKARPQGVHAVAGATRRPVQRRLDVHRDPAAEIDRIVPVDGAGGEPRQVAPEDRIVAERGDDARAKALP